MRKHPKVKENAPSQWRIPPLGAHDNKYTRGHLLVLGGTPMTGAARLAALAAQRAGAGLVTLGVPQTAWAVYAGTMLSVIVRPANATQWAAMVKDERIHPVLIGPGAGATPRTKAAMLASAKAGKTLILDADALTLLASDATLRRTLMKTPKILTPHEGEYGRLAASLKLDVTADKAERAQVLAKALNAVVLLKGSDTFIADTDGTLCVMHPPAWLATGGTGDVLAGIIAALVGQGMALYDAACEGAWLHSEAAKLHGHGMIAEDVVASLPTVLRRL